MKPPWDVCWPKRAHPLLLLLKVYNIDNDIDVVIDLGKRQTIQSVSATFMQDYLGWIWMPSEVEISVSNNNEDFSLLTVIKNDLPFEKGGFYLKDFEWKGKLEIRYVRYLAKSSGKRTGGWLFTDEMVILNFI